MDPRQTVQRIANKEIGELDISWRDYQGLVWWLVCQETHIRQEHVQRRYRQY